MGTLDSRANRAYPSTVPVTSIPLLIQIFRLETRLHIPLNPLDYEGLRLEDGLYASILDASNLLQSTYFAHSLRSVISMSSAARMTSSVSRVMSETEVVFVGRWFARGPSHAC